MINWQIMATKQKETDNSPRIPFGKAVRVGNFKLWRSNISTGKGQRSVNVPCVHVSDLDGAWMVRIPSTSNMYGFICSQYATTDDRIREQMIGMVISNIYHCSMIASPALHDAFMFLKEMMEFPYLLLPEKEMERRMADGLRKVGMEKTKAKDHISKMMEYRKELYELIEKKKADYIEDYERQQAERLEREPEELEQLRRDELAEQAADILQEKGED